MKTLFSGPEITLSQLLDAKEQKSFLQKKYLQSSESLICLSVNMPGKVKKNIASELFYSEGCNLVEKEFMQAGISFSQDTGDFLILPLNGNPVEAKRRAVRLESAFEWSRMLDIDVITKEGPVERSVLGLEPRPCLVCNKNAKFCSANALHSKSELERVISDLFRKALANRLGRICYESLIQEVHCTPKPGLVDENNNGSHKDMDLPLFEKSAACLHPYFEECSLYGFDGKSFNELRKLGIQAEETMFKTTIGVNTHKGAIFTLGLFSYAASRTLSSDPTHICSEIAKTTEVLKSEKQSGARKSAVSGYPIVTNQCFALYQNLSPSLNENQKLCLVLLELISQTDDTNIVSRSDENTLIQARKLASQTLDKVKKTGDFSPVYELDNWFINHNISPGGSADLLALFCALKSHQSISNTTLQLAETLRIPVGASV